MKNSDKPILTISLLASNRLETLPRCLDSLTSIREAIPSELIIVDTSNNPEVHECILRYTDKVEMFEWCNDFAKARNVGIEKAKGEWFMFIDDDEWFIDSAPLIEFFVSGEYKEYGFAYYYVKNYMDIKFKTYTTAWLKRLMKLESITKFRGKIHESLGPDLGKMKLIDAIIGHTGYIYETEEQQKKHFNRNVSLLVKMEQEEPDNLRWKNLLVQEYRAIRDWKGLELYCQKTIDYLRKQSYKVYYLDVGQIYLGYIHALLNQNKKIDAKTLYKRCEKVFEHTFIHKAYADAFMAAIYFEFEDYEACYEHAVRYIEAYNTYQNDSPKYRMEEVASIYSEPFVDAIHFVVHRYKYVCEFKLGKYEDMRGHYHEICWDGRGALGRAETMIQFLDTYILRKDYLMLEEIIGENLKLSYMRPVLAQWFMKERKSDVQKFLTLSNIVREMDIWRWYELYAEFPKLQELETDDAKKIAHVLVMQTPNVFQIPEMVHKAFGEQNVELESLFAELDFMTWKNQLAEHFACINMQQLDELKVRLENSSLNGDVRFAYFMMLYTEQKLLHTDKNDRSFEFYNEMLYLFSQYTCATYETLYADEIPNMELEQLPNNYQAALWLKVYFEEVEKDIKTALPCLSRVMETYPSFQEVIKGYLERLKQEMMV